MSDIEQNEPDDELKLTPETLEDLESEDDVKGGRAYTNGPGCGSDP